MTASGFDTVEGDGATRVQRNNKWKEEPQPFTNQSQQLTQGSLIQLSDLSRLFLILFPALLVSQSELHSVSLLLVIV